MDATSVLQGLTLLLGFYLAWSIGANDVANAMGTSVGSKALTLKRAVLIAAVLEFSGALLAGADVSETIRHGVVDPALFIAEPLVFVLGMMSALLATGILLQTASYLGLPISATHSIVGALTGFGIAAKGVQAIQWVSLGEIGVSWIVSPLLSGGVAAFIFFIIEKKILTCKKPLEAAKKAAPFFIFSCCYTIALSIPTHDVAASLQIPSWLVPLSLAFCCSLGFVFFIDKLFPVPLLTVQGTTLPAETSSHNGAEKIFAPLQILSACLVAFAHGANDVSNATGPAAAVFGILKAELFLAHEKTPLWLLSLGGAGIVLGLATWGWRVIETIGKKITELTPSRGFAAEFGAAATILLASKWGMPISTTHALVGAVFGVGFVQGLRTINIKTLREILLSWIVTIPLCALLSILIFSILSLFF